MFMTWSLTPQGWKYAQFICFLILLNLIDADIIGSDSSKKDAAALNKICNKNDGKISKVTGFFFLWKRIEEYTARFIILFILLFSETISVISSPWPWPLRLLEYVKSKKFFCQTLPSNFSTLFQSSYFHYRYPYYYYCRYYHCYYYI